MATPGGLRAVPRALQRLSANAAKTYATTATAVDYPEPDQFLPEHIPPPVSPRTERKRAIGDAKPFSEFLTDTFNRQHDYLRISVTERCNLRCLYCMPEEGIELSPNKQLLTSAEIYYLSALFVNQGVNKIRLTGGEPTVRKDIVPLMQQIGSLRRNGLKELALTTNAISLHRKLDAMVEAGLTGVNISLDTLDPFQFQLLTRRQGFDAVMKSINRVQEMNKLGAKVKLKINAVVMRGLNHHQILPFVEKTREEDIEVRFIEYMPFGGNKWSENKMLPYAEMVDMIRKQYPGLERLRDAKNDTSKTYQVPGFKGRVGFITSMTHNFCGTCNRLRITSDGNLKVCLHGNDEVSLRDLLRSDHGGDPMDEAAFDAIRQIELDRRKGSELRYDGEEGWMSKEQQLLKVIGAAVKRKEEKHAGMGELENMKNRPMILIGEQSRSSSGHPISLDERRLRAQQFQTRSRPHVPLHLLHTSHSGANQVRYNSSKSTGTSDGLEIWSSPDTKSSAEAKAESGSGSFFGFQSLSALFASAEPRRRYSRPDDHRDAAATPAPPETPPPMPAPQPLSESDVKVVPALFTSPQDIGESRPDDTSIQRDTSGVHEDLLPRAATSEDAPAHSTQADPASVHDDLLPRASINKVHATTRKSRALVRKGQRVLRLGNGALKPMGPRDKAAFKYFDAPANLADGRPSFSPDGPFRSPPALGQPSFKPLPVLKRRASPGTSQVKHPNQAWGLNVVQASREAPASETPPDVEPARSVGPVHVVLRKVSKPVFEKPVKPAPRLTHVKSSGEAHMVDVGGKTSTTRVAIAIATVTFSNLEPFRLISENNNKKGDVLGVSRIAGVMAAKRTSDLIPLCHPIALSKVDVDVELVPPSRTGASAKHGKVTIRAQVECVGPTGVEMEALSAVSGAALTVFDMNKAVDRSITIRNASVVYKCGGNSGLHVSANWAIHKGMDFFMERGLEVPAETVQHMGRKGKQRYQDGIWVATKEDQAS